MQTQHNDFLTHLGRPQLQLFFKNLDCWVALRLLLCFIFNFLLIYCGSAQKKREREKSTPSTLLSFPFAKTQLKKVGEEKKPLLKPRNQNNCYCKFVCTVWHESGRSLNMVLMSRCFWLSTNLHDKRIIFHIFGFPSLSLTSQWRDRYKMVLIIFCVIVSNECGLFQCFNIVYRFKWFIEIVKLNYSSEKRDAQYNTGNIDAF